MVDIRFESAEHGMYSVFATQPDGARLDAIYDVPGKWLRETVERLSEQFPLSRTQPIPSEIG